MTMDWQGLISTLAGLAIAGVGGMLVRKINTVLTHVEAFSKHILECEARNEAHAKIHQVTERAVERRLTMLEAREHPTHD